MEEYEKATVEVVEMETGVFMQESPKNDGVEPGTETWGETNDGL